VVFPEIAEYYKEVLQNKSAAAKKRKEEEKKWAAANLELAKKLDHYFSGKSPVIIPEQIVQER